MNPTMKKFGYPGTLIREYRYWTVLLRPQQVTLGSLVLGAKEEVGAFHQLSAEAFAELRTVIGHIEQVLGDEFDFQKINYLMLMMVDPDVHFHVFPRYKTAASFDQVRFPDHGWPGPPALSEFIEMEPALQATLIEHLRKCWPDS